MGILSTSIRAFALAGALATAGLAAAVPAGAHPSFGGMHGAMHGFHGFGSLHGMHSWGGHMGGWGHRGWGHGGWGNHNWNNNVNRNINRNVNINRNFNRNVNVNRNLGHGHWGHGHWVMGTDGMAFIAGATVSGAGTGPRRSKILACRSGTMAMVVMGMPMTTIPATTMMTPRRTPTTTIPTTTPIRMTTSMGWIGTMAAPAVATGTTPTVTVMAAGPTDPRLV